MMECLTEALADLSILPKHIPDDILKIIFQYLCIGDRFRMKLVCKSWKRVLTQYHIPQALEPPWEILSDDSYSNPEPFLTEIRFRSLSEQRVYHFNLPGGGIGWLCGSSNGWLLIATGNNKSDSDMLLWNPLSGVTRKLPPLSTHHTFLLIKKNISRSIDRVQVFSVGSVECVVAVIFYQVDGYNQVAVCSPQEKAWTTFGTSTGDHHAEKIFYRDILYHNRFGLLFGLATDASIPEGETKKLCQTLYLTGGGCKVNLHIVFVKQIDQVDFFTMEYHPIGFACVRGSHVLRLVEDSSPINDGKLLILTVALACLARINPNRSSAIVKSFRCSQTANMIVQVADLGEPSLQVLTTIGNQAIFLGATGSLAIPCPAPGAEADCVYFAVDHAEGLLDNSYYLIREQGVFFLESKLLRRTSSKNVRCPLQSKIGWFTPYL